MENLEYRNEDDRAYGLAGMLYSLGMLDGLDYVVGVDIDGGEQMITFSHSYFFNGSPSVSPKAIWERLLRHYQLTSVMAISNVMARSIIRDHERPGQSLLDSLFDVIRSEGLEECQLEEDEAAELCDRTYHYAMRLFGNPRVHPALRDFSSLLSRYRRLSGREVREQLEYLQLV